MLEDLSPIKFIEKHFNLDGKPFTIINERLENARHYLNNIYNVPIFELPRVKKPLVIVKGRQVEMTTTYNNVIAYWLHNIPYYKVLYVVPKSDQAKRFSETRFDPLFRDRRDKSVLEVLKGGTYNKSVKEFANGSILYAYAAAEEGDNIRGLSADAIIKDEYQDFDPAAEEVIDMCASHSPWRINVAMGTPKYCGSHFEDRWRDSTQHYYYLLCPTCGKYFKLVMSSMVKDFDVQCTYCGYVEDKRKMMPFGKWIATNKDAPAIGYHLSQIYVPNLSKDDIEKEIRKKEREGADVEKYVKNEVMGEFYQGHVQKPSTVDIMPSFDSKLPYNMHIPLTSKVFMGVDWGGWNSADNDPDSSYTVVTIGAFNKHGKLFINRIEIVDDKDELKHVERIAFLMESCHVSLAVADKGYGKIKNMELLKQFPTRFRMCKYLQGSASTMYKPCGDGDTILINRDYSLEELYSSMKYGKLAIPLNKETEWIIKQFLNFEISIEEHGDQVYKKFNKVEGANRRTDAVHAINYLRIAAFMDPAASEHSAMVSTELPPRSPLPVIAGRGFDKELNRMRQNFKMPIIRRNPE